jgi:hypothetical protein
VIRALLARLRPAITTEFSVWQRDWMTYSRDCPKGSGYCEDWGRTNLLRKTWKWRGLVLHWRYVDREEVPAHVVIARATIGYSGPWESKFNHHMKGSTT